VFHFKSMKTFAIGVVSAAAVLATSASAETALRGASLFDEEHAYTKTLREFERLVGEKYSGDVSFEVSLNGELGDESDFVTFLQQGVAIDYAIMAPSNMATFAPSIPLMDMPFLFRDLDHWNTARPNCLKKQTSASSDMQAAVSVTWHLLNPSQTWKS